MWKWKSIYKLVSPILFRKKKPFCRIENIDIDNRIVVICCMGIETAIRIKMKDIIFDNTMIQNFSSVQVSRLGYYYGLIFHEENEISNYLNNTHFTIYDNNDKKCIILWLHRNKTITYLDKESNKNYTFPLIDIFNNQKLISEFPVSQALYIGFLVGMMLGRKQIRIIS